MGRKTKKQIEREKRKEKKARKLLFSRLLRIIIYLALAVLSIFKISAFGIALNNVFSFIFGNFYLVIFISLIIICLFKIFNKKSSFRFYFSLLLINIFLLLLSGIFYDTDVNSFSTFSSYLKNYLNLDLFTSILVNYGAGLVGNGLFVLSNVSIGYTFTIIIDILGLVLGLLLLIPHRLYQKLFLDIEDSKELSKEEKKIDKKYKKDKKLELKNKREEKLKEYEANRKKQIEDQALEGEKELLNISSVENDTKPDMTSKSAYFLDMSKADDSSNDGNIDGEENTFTIQELTEKKYFKSKKVGEYHFPPKSLLTQKTKKTSSANKRAAEYKGRRILEILKEFEIDASLVDIHIGPSVTKFEILPSSSIKISRILQYKDNIKMELAATEIRIEAPIPGKRAVGIEIPNEEKTTVLLSELMSSFPNNCSEVTFALGKGLLGENVYCDISKMPHLLIAGATGSGKSVCINSIIMSIIMRAHPDDVKLVLVDPKKVEFLPYHDIPHLLWPVITDPKMATMMLEKLVVIMEQRYDQFSQVGVKHIIGYNQYVDFHNSESPSEPIDKMPYIVVIIDELSDLMQTASKDVQGSIQRISQLARASGIHLVIATQRPSVDVITGVIKSNLPSRIAFAVASQVDSKTILDTAGAENLLGYGDMLYSPQSEPNVSRLQGVYVNESEINAVASFAKKYASPKYDDTYYSILNNAQEYGNSSSTSNVKEVDPLYDEVVEYIKTSQRASSSLLQTRFGIGFNRATRIINTLEDNGLIGPSNGAKGREVYIKPDEDDK